MCLGDWLLAAEAKDAAVAPPLVPMEAGEGIVPPPVPLVNADVVVPKVGRALGTCLLLDSNIWGGVLHNYFIGHLSCHKGRQTRQFALTLPYLPYYRSISSFGNQTEERSTSR